MSGGQNPVHAIGRHSQMRRTALGGRGWDGIPRRDERDALEQPDQDML
jgi:hypothetical protein